MMLGACPTRYGTTCSMLGICSLLGTCFATGVREDKMIKRGPRHKQATSLGERLARFSRQVRERAVALPPGEERAALMRKLEQSEQAVRISEWLCSPAPTSNQPLNKVP